MLLRSPHNHRILYVALLGAVCGCSSSNADLADGGRQSTTGDATGRSVTVKQLEDFASQRDFESAPQIVEALDAPSMEVRELAIEAAERVFGTIRLRAYAPPEVRREAVASYRRMIQIAQETGKTHLIDTMPALIDRMEDADEAVRRQAYEDIKRVCGLGLSFRADAQLAERQQVVERYRGLWRLWNRPGNEMLERLRYPEKMREYKRQRVEDFRRRRAEARAKAGA